MPILLRILLRILLADDQPVMHFALRALLERQPDLEVVGEAADAAICECRRPTLLSPEGPLLSLRPMLQSAVG